MLLFSQLHTAMSNISKAYGQCTADALLICRDIIVDVNFIKSCLLLSQSTGRYLGEEVVTKFNCESGILLL